MTSKNRMPATLRFEAPDRIPHFEMVVQLTQEVLAVVHADGNILPVIDDYLSFSAAAPSLGGFHRRDAVLHGGRTCGEPDFSTKS